MLDTDKIIIPFRNPSLIRVFRVRSNFSVEDYCYLFFRRYLVESSLGSQELSICNNGFEVVILMSFRSCVVFHIGMKIFYQLRIHKVWYSIADMFDCCGKDSGHQCHFLFCPIIIDSIGTSGAIHILVMRVAMSRSAKEWSSLQIALAYPDAADTLPHRSEGESVLICIFNEVNIFSDYRIILNLVATVGIEEDYFCPDGEGSHSNISCRT